jgi:4-aminobutyrate aminotransferase-like enzyme
VFISDEVQTGFGRTGKMWGIDHYNVEPDIVTMAKGIANGLPLAACVTTTAIANTFTKSTISTFGGNLLSCAAANKVIEIVQRDELDKHAERLGQILLEGLSRLQKKYPRIVGDVRGLGLMAAIEFVVDETVQNRTPNPQALARFVEETRQRGLLVGRGGLYGNVARFSPPLTVTEDEVKEALACIDDSLSVTAAS